MQIIDGKLVAKLTRENIARQVQALPQDKLGKIGLAVILVGDDPASKVYVRNKINGCAEVGIASTLEAMSADSTFEEVAAKIMQLNADPEISGILLQPSLAQELGLTVSYAGARRGMRRPARAGLIGRSFPLPYEWHSQWR